MTQIFTLDTLKYMELNGFGEEGVTYFKKEL